MVNLYGENSYSKELTTSQEINYNEIGSPKPSAAKPAIIVGEKRRSFVCCHLVNVTMCVRSLGHKPINMQRDPFRWRRTINSVVDSAFPRST